MKTAGVALVDQAGGMWVLLMLALAVAVSAECPRHCECKWRSGKESALCARAGLNAVPPRLDPTTQLLDLAENRLTTLRDDAFAAAGLLNLQRLYLPSCSLKVIRQYAFRALVNLVELDLSRNRLESIPSHAFDSIPELRELRLGGNPLTKIKDEAFSALPHLVRLTLSSCKISEIEPRGFKGLEGTLEYLDLSKNKLHVLHVAVLAPLRSLKGLELASNPWDCNCELRPLRDWMIRKNVPATVVPDCASPSRLMSQSWDRLDLEDFACLPEVTGSTNNFKGLEGEEVTLVCRVNGVPAPRVRWVRAGRLLANTTTTSNFNAGRTFMLRSEGHTSNLTIRSADMQDSGLYTCNAENRAGKAEVVLSLTIEKKTHSKGFGGKALMAGMAVSAVIVLSSCLIGLCAYETRKKRQLDRWNEQIVTTNHHDSYEKIEANLKTNSDVSRVVASDINRKRGDYRNVPSHDPEEEYEGYGREEIRDRRDPSSPSLEARWRRADLESASTRGEIVQDLHIPRLSEYNIR